MCAYVAKIRTWDILISDFCHRLRYVNFSLLLGLPVGCRPQASNFERATELKNTSRLRFGESHRKGSFRL